MQENQSQPSSDDRSTPYGFCPYCMSKVKIGENCPVCGLAMGAYKAADHHLPPGTVLSGRYLIGRALGEGGFGITYIGCDLRLEMKVAIKEYFPVDTVFRNSKVSLSVISHSSSAAKDFDKGVLRFLTEARTMARMDKLPEIVGVKDFFEANRTAYIVMEFVDGTDFQTLVRQKGGRIPPGELFPIIEPLFGALNTMHLEGMVHRDISPDNLMMEAGKVRLLDFGCTRETSNNQETFTIALKQGFGPIEQYQGKGQGPWTDVYALSATIYYCLTGRRPPQALDRMLEDDLVPPQNLGVPLTDRQQAALMKGMAVNPRDRYQSVEELYAGLYGWDAAAPEENVQGADARRVAGPAVLPEEEPEVPITGQDDLAGVYTEWPQDDWAGQPDWNSPDGSAEGDRYARNEAGSEDAAEGTLTQGTRSRRFLYIGIGIAVVLVALVLILAVILYCTPSDRQSGDDSETGSDQVTMAEFRQTELSEEDRQWLIDAGLTQNPAGWTIAVWDSGEEEDLTALLKETTVDAIILRPPAGTRSIETELDLSKPVKVEAETLTFCGTVTVSEGGLVWTEGELGVDSLLRVNDGGRICLAEGGRLEVTGILWLQNRDELEFLFPDASVVINGQEYQGENWASSDTDYLLAPDLDE